MFVLKSVISDLIKTGQAILEFKHADGQADGDKKKQSRFPF
jgi:hypothetical protein